MKKPEVIFNSLLDAVKTHPDYRVLKRVTLGDSELPIKCGKRRVRDIPIIVLDLETTGFDPEKDGITEVGLVRVMYDPVLHIITEISDSISLYNDPGIDIPEVVINKTGITNEMVKGTKVSTSDIEHFFSNDPLVIAHNAGFDRKFFDKAYPELKYLRWACSRDGADWAELGFDSTKLEYINFKAGFFYEGHRAEVDCFALINMLLEYPDAMKSIYQSQDIDLVDIHMVGIPFSQKDIVKDMGARWEGEVSHKYGKHWWFKGLTGDEVDKTIEAVSKPLYNTKFHIEAFDARSKFK